MRRLVALFVLALLGAAIYGVSGASSGIVVNHQGVSGTVLRSELSAISRHDALQCYVTALFPANYAPGGGGDSIAAKGATGWTELRVEGLAIDEYVTGVLKYHPNADQLVAAETSLESEMTSEASASGLPCTNYGTAADAIAQMPAEMRTAEIEYQATSLYLVARLKSATPLTMAAAQTYYDQHTSDYDTLCVSVALVPPGDVAAFGADQSAGMSVAELAEKYSQGATAKTGGAAGCYAPSNASYPSVRGDVVALTLNAFATTPQYIHDSQNNQNYALYVATTKRSMTPFAEAQQRVLADLQAANASSANAVKDTMLESAAIHVDPAFGVWSSSTTGPAVFAPSLPAVGGVTGAKPLRTATTTYK